MSEKMTVNQWLKSIGRKQKWLAESLGKSQQYISAVCNGSKEASPEVAYSIQRLSGGLVSAEDLQLRGRDPLAVCRTLREQGAAITA